MVKLKRGFEPSEKAYGMSQAVGCLPREIG